MVPTLIGNPDPVTGTVRRECSTCGVYLYVQVANSKSFDLPGRRYSCLSCAIRTRHRLAGLLHEGKVFDENSSSEELSKLVDSILKETKH